MRENGGRVQGDEGVKAEEMDKGVEVGQGAWLVWWA